MFILMSTHAHGHVYERVYARTRARLHERPCAGHRHARKHARLPARPHARTYVCHTRLHERKHARSLAHSRRRASASLTCSARTIHRAQRVWACVWVCVCRHVRTCTLICKNMRVGENSTEMERSTGWCSWCQYYTVQIMHTLHACSHTRAYIHPCTHAYRYLYRRFLHTFVGVCARPVERRPALRVLVPDVPWPRELLP